ncbi:hypothetical protein AB0J71_41795 [Nonomuraea sp. NPDC049637]|uniref:hypothetical protein n=1 Tax=Nonomuraea sp. NPDC049637 TaxID=3154356 RepID=UPI003416FB8E
MAFLLGPSRYKAESSLILTAPPSGGTLSMDPTKPVGLTNPLLQYNDGLRTVAGILIVAINSKEEMGKLGVRENDGTEVVIDDGRSNSDLLGVVTLGPFLHVKVESGEPGTAQRILERAHQRLREELIAYQTKLGAPKTTFIAINTVALLPPEYDGARRTQLAVGVLVATLFLGLAGAYGVVVRGLFPRRPPAGTAKADDDAPEEAEVAAGTPAKEHSANGQVPAGTPLNSVADDEDVPDGQAAPNPHR